MFKEKYSIILYDKENMEVLGGNLTNTEFVDDTKNIEITCMNAVSEREYIKGLEQTELKFSVSNLNKIELDPTTMLKIAKFNKEKDILILEQKEKELTNSIQELKKEKEKILNKIESIKEYTKDFFGSGFDSVEEYNEEMSNKIDYSDWDY